MRSTSHWAYAPKNPPESGQGCEIRAMLTAFGVVALTFMTVMYALERLSESVDSTAEVARMRLLDRLEGVGAEEDDVELRLEAAGALSLGIGRLGTVVVGAEVLDLGLVALGVVGDQEVLDLMFRHRRRPACDQR